ncbi:TldD/PmbA family protein [bacterium]|nr:TldD/PmbA family protein [candidate division CSSED10-310 bacterium]
MKAYLQSFLNKYAKDVDYLDIRVEESEETVIGFRGESIDMLRQSSEKGGFIRAIFKGGWGFASFNSLDEDTLNYYFKSAVKQAHFTGKDETRLAPVPVVNEVLPLQVKTDPRSISLDRKMDILKSYNQMILTADPRIPTSSVSYLDTYKHKWLATSEGSYIEAELIDIGGGLSAVAVDKGQTQICSVGFGSSSDFNVVLNNETELVKACEDAVRLLDAPAIKGGVYTVIADPKLAGVFVHESFGHTSEGEKVFENKGLAEIMKIGRRFGSDVLTIYDTGLEPGYRGSLDYDDEGVKSQKTMLIKDGVLVGRLHSRETAGKMGEFPTGNGRALNYKFAPIPRMRTTCIDQGETSFEDMIHDIDLGVYAVDAMGGQGGEMFSFTAGRAYMIRHGKIEELVKNVTLSGNLFQTLIKIDAVGDDFQIHDSGGGCGKGAQFPLPVSAASPTIRIRDVVIAGD